MLNEYLSGYISNSYLLAFVLFLILFFLFRVLLYVAQKIILLLTHKTRTDLDDKLISALSRPLTLLASLFSLLPALSVLDLNSVIGLGVTRTLYSLIIVVVARIIYLTINVFLVTGFRRVSGRAKIKIDESVVSLFTSIVNVVLIAICFLYILSVWGVEIGPLLAGLGIAGLAVALALQPILSNIFSGAAVILDGSVRVGDLVYLDGESIKGRIEKIGLRSTRVRTFDNEFIILPNNKLADSAIQNVALPEPRTRVVVPFGVAYGSDVDKVKKLVSREISKIDAITENDDVIVRFDAMADSSLNFTVYFYVGTFENRAAAKDEANTRIYNALNKAGIEIPFPQMDVRMKK